MSDRRVVHVIEPGGSGGVYQHAAELARRVVAQGGEAVFHTADDREQLDLPGVRVCGCVSWQRGVRPRVLRQAATALRYMLCTLPHFIRSTGGGVVNVQGLFRIPLYAVTIVLLKPRSRRVVFSPHNTFARSGRGWEEVVLRWVARRADVVVCYTRDDEDRVRSWGARTARCPLVQWIPAWDATARDRWRDLLGARPGVPLLLVAGQVRPDKGVDQAIRCLPLLSNRATLAVMGEDKGDADRCLRLAKSLGIDVTWRLGFQRLDDLVAGIAAADVVLLPYLQASQSAVASLAAAVGTPTVCYPVGGLPEQATLTTDAAEPAALAAGVERLLAGDRPVAVPSGDDLGAFEEVLYR